MMLQCFLLLKSNKNYSKPFFRFINLNRIIWTMKQQNMLNLLNERSDSKFLVRKWDINDQSNANYSVGNKIINNTEILKSNLRDYKDACVALKGDITTYRRVS